MAKYQEPQPGEMLKYLPAIYRETDGQEEKFLRDFLSAFEKILIGREDTYAIPGGEDSLHHYHGEIVRQYSLETTIAHIADFFDPEETWDEFLPWLASWAAFSLRADLPEASQRKFISEIFQLYRRRGTRDNLVKVLKIFTVGEPTVIEDKTRPHQFQVKLVLMKVQDAKELSRQVAIAYALIDLEKPAYTSYELNAEHVSMQIGDDAAKQKIGRSTIGKDTLLGVVK